MKKLKKVSNMFSPKDLKEYKNKFKNKQIRFVFSKIALIFKEDIDVKTLFKGEEIIFLADKDKNMFVQSFLLLKDKIDKKIDWESFGKLMWYSYQTSSYWKDKKHGNNNIFSKENYVEKNEEKRDLYYLWINSLPKEIKNYNLKIQRSLKVIF